MGFIEADIPQYCGDFKVRSVPGYINLARVEYTEFADDHQLACYARDDHLLGYVDLAVFRKAIRIEPSA